MGVRNEIKVDMFEYYCDWQLILYAAADNLIAFERIKYLYKFGVSVTKYNLLIKTNISQINP